MKPILIVCLFAVGCGTTSSTSPSSPATIAAAPSPTPKPMDVNCVDHIKIRLADLLAEITDGEISTSDVLALVNDLMDYVSGRDCSL